MNTFTVELQAAEAQAVAFTDDELRVELVDGRTLTVPLAWYPRLAHASPAERDQWRLIGRGEGIHWPALDEDISVENLLTGKPSGESQASFARWQEERRTKLKSVNHSKGPKL